MKKAFRTHMLPGVRIAAWLIASSLTACGGGGDTGTPSQGTPVPGWSVTQRLDQGDGTVAQVKAWHDTGGIRRVTWVKLGPGGRWLVQSAREAASGQWAASGPDEDLADGATSRVVDFDVHSSGAAMALISSRSVNAQGQASAQLQAATRTGTGAWTFTILSQFEHASQPRISQDGQGRFGAVWQEWRTGDPLTSPQPEVVRFRTWDSRTLQWEREFNISFPGMTANTSRLAMEPAGGVGLSWVADFSGVNRGPALYWISGIGVAGLIDNLTTRSMLELGLAAGGYLSAIDVVAQGDVAQVLLPISVNPSGNGLVPLPELHTCEFATSTCRNQGTIQADRGIVGNDGVIHAAFASSGTRATLVWGDSSTGGPSARLRFATADVGSGDWSIPADIPPDTIPRIARLVDLSMSPGGRSLLMWLPPFARGSQPLQYSFGAEGQWSASAEGPPIVGGFVVGMSSDVQDDGRAHFAAGTGQGSPVADMTAVYASSFQP